MELYSAQYSVTACNVDSMGAGYKNEEIYVHLFTLLYTSETNTVNNDTPIKMN